jgi:hypothetical protein
MSMKIGGNGMPDDEQYMMKVDLNVFVHLGINHYSNNAAVMFEAVANAWAADAENVEIGINPNSK